MPHATLVRNFTQPKAQRDDIYLLKEAFVQASYRIERVRKFMGWQYLELMATHPINAFVKARVKRTYYDMIDTMRFDKQVALVLTKHAQEKREQYYLFDFRPVVLEELNDIPNKPKFLSSPLVYENKKIVSLFTQPFYGRYRNDSFEHATLTVRRKGEELFFAVHGKGMFYPSITCPFLSEHPIATVNEQFKIFDKTFDKSYLVTKGLFNQWWDMRF